MAEADAPTNVEETPAGGSSGSAAYLASVCLVPSLGGLLFGFDTAVISGTFGFVESQFHLSKFQVGWFGSSALVGCILGAAAAGMLGDRFGRKPVLIVSALLFFVSALFSAIPPSFEILTCARIVGGLGVGMASVLAPMYISELVPARLRGRLVALYQLSIVIGILAAYFSNWLLFDFSRANPGAFGGTGLFDWLLVSEVWRGMFGAEMLPAGLFFLLMFFVPESPRWLAKEGRQEKALAVLSRIGGREPARREMSEIQDALAHEEGTLAELFRPGLRLALLVGVGLSFFGQLTGVNIVVYYGPTVLEHAGFEKVGAFQYQVGLGLVNLIFTLIAMSLIDRLGRRPLLIGGMSVVVLALAITGLLFLCGAPHFVTDPGTGETRLELANQAVGPWIVAVLTVYMACVALSICAVIWVLTPEIFPNRVRGRAMSIATLTNWSTNAVSIFLFPWYVHRLGMHTGFLTFAAICFVGTVFFWRYVPETKGKSLEEIERSWTPRLHFPEQD
ncbi:MAG: sugar porter family MFS transporter [Planctomycetota bacterium]